MILCLYVKLNLKCIRFFLNFVHSVYNFGYQTQKIMNSYNFCLFKLFNLKYDINTSDDFNKMNNDLETHGLSSFQLKYNQDSIYQ